MTTIYKHIYRFTSCKEWPNFLNHKDCNEILERFYAQNKGRYRHPRHAFNSLCKHMGEVHIEKITIKENGLVLTTIWLLKTHTKTEVFHT